MQDHTNDRERQLLIKITIHAFPKSPHVKGVTVIHQGKYPPLICSDTAHPFHVHLTNPEAVFVPVLLQLKVFQS